MNKKRLKKLGILHPDSAVITKYKYTDVPTGDLDVARLFNGKTNCWRLPVNTAELESKKKIIISDWTVRYHVDNYNNMIKLWQTFLAEGFEIAVWTGALTPARSLSELLRALYQVQPIHRNALEKELAAQDISRDEYIIADVGMSKKIYNELHDGDSDDLDLDSEALVGLPASELEKLLDSIAIEPCVRLKLPNTTQNFEVLEKYICKTRAYGVDIRELAPHHSIPKIWKLDANNEKVFAWPQHNKAYVNIHNYLKTISLCENLEWKFKEVPLLITYLQVALPTIRQWYELRKIGALKQLKTLKVNAGGILQSPDLRAEDRDYLLDSISIPSSIQSLEVSHFPLGWHLLNQWMISFPQLEVMSISHCRLYGDFPQGIKLSKTIRIFNAVDTLITSQQIQQLIMEHSNLESIHFYYKSDSESVLPTVINLPASLHSLRITFSGYRFAWKEIIPWFVNQANLKHIYLQQCQFDDSLPSDVTLSKSILKFDVSETHINWVQLQQLIQHHPSIQQLTLQRCNLLGTVPETFRLPDSLQRLELNEAVVHPAHMSGLVWLITNSQIKSLNMSGWESMNALLEHSFSQPNKINEINLVGSKNVSHDLISFLVVQCPQLVKLDISYCPGITDHQLQIWRQQYPTLTIVSEWDSLRHKVYTPFEQVLDTRKRSYILDAATAGSSTGLKAKQLFTYKRNVSPHPKSYRIDIFNKKSSAYEFIPDDNKVIKKLGEVTNSQIEDAEALYQREYGQDPIYFLGRIELYIGQQDWIPLPSLSTSDKILPEQIFTSPPINGDLGYCKAENLYYFKPSSIISCRTIVSFIVKADLQQNLLQPSEISMAECQMLQQLQFNVGNLVQNDSYHYMLRLPKRERVQLLVNFFNQFTPAPLHGSVGTQEEIINTIIAQKVGVCRHRAQAFMALAEPLALGEVRIVSNDIHRFVEVSMDDEPYSLRADLGGGYVELEIEAITSTTQSVQEVIKVPASSAAVLPLAKVAEVALENIFNTWDMMPSAANNMTDYIKELLTQADTLAPDKKNILVVLNGEQIESFYTAIVAKHPCYFLYDLNDVREKTLIIDKDGSYHYQNSELIQFVKQAKPGDILLVNWSDYKTSQVGYNTMMDVVRSIKGVPIPDDVIVINLLDRRKSKNMGDDFYSRNRLISDCPAALPKESVLPLIENDKINDYFPCIEFYTDDWRSILLGKLSFQQGTVHLESSSLLAVMAASKVVLRNAPWHLADFRIFLTEMLTTRTVEINGDHFPIPNEITFIRDDRPYGLWHHRGFSLRSYDASLNLQIDFVLNMGTFSNMFQRYHCKNNLLIEMPGLIESHKQNMMITLLMTESLSNMQWAQLLEAGQKHRCFLNILVTSDVILPSEVMHQIDTYLNNLKAEQSQFKAEYIVSNDAHFSSQNDYHVIPVNTGTSYSDLMEKLSIHDENGRKIFTHNLSVLAASLLAGENVVVRGRLSSLLLSQLESLFLSKPYITINGEMCYLEKGSLTIFSEHEPQKRFINFRHEIVRENDKWLYFYKHASFPKGMFSSLYHQMSLLGPFKVYCERFYKMTGMNPFSYVQLNKMINDFVRYPHRNPIKAFIKQKKNYLELLQAAKTAWQEVIGHHNKNKVPMDIMDKRLQIVMNKLQDSPYLFIAGSSGIGKSDFVENRMKQIGYFIFKGMDKLKLFMTHPGKTILFIDEANLYADGTFDSLEGLFNQPSGLIIDGKFHPLLNDHHVIFAGNFGNFKGRQQHAFFDRHGSIIAFKEFPNDFLVTNILQPVMKKLLPELDKNSLQSLQMTLLQLYHCINSMQIDTHPMTVRNLQMMVMRLPRLLMSMSNITHAACMAAYEEACTAFNKEERNELKKWIVANIAANVNIKSEREKAKAKIINLPGDHLLITKSRRNPLRVLDDVFAIRQLRIEHPALARCGANGLIFEGGSGGGKSSFALKYLQQKGYVIGEQYYHITPTDLVKMQELLEKAFHEGAVVVIDEMNTLPLEHILNSLLSGVDLSGNGAKKPGFFVIGTLNPSKDYENRHPLSAALLNRFTKLSLKEYTRKELIDITTHICGNEKLAIKLVNAYEKASHFSNIEHKRPAPRPRNLFSTATTMCKR